MDNIKLEKPQQTPTPSNKLILVTSLELAPNQLAILQTYNYNDKDIKKKYIQNQNHRLIKGFFKNKLKDIEQNQYQQSFLQKVHQNHKQVSKSQNKNDHNKNLQQISLINRYQQNQPNETPKINIRKQLKQSQKPQQQTKKDSKKSLQDFLKVPTNQNTNTTFYKTKNKILLPSLEKKQSPMSKTSIMFNKKKDIESLLSQIDIDSEINLKMFKIESTLGKGSYAQVNKSRSIDDPNQIFAIKTYDLKNLQEVYQAKNLQREIENLKTLKHPNIIKLHHVIKDYRQISLVMEYTETITLKTYQKKCVEQQIELKKARQVIKQILEGLQHCHSRGVAHRDIKPDNILVDKEMNVKLVDFGFSVQQKSNQRLNLYCGTPQFMSPQIVQKILYCGKKADIWAVGVLYYYILYNMYPFRGGNERELFSNIMSGNFVKQDFPCRSLKEFFTSVFNVDENKRPSCAQVLIFDHFDGI